MNCGSRDSASKFTANDDASICSTVSTRATTVPPGHLHLLRHLRQTVQRILNHCRKIKRPPSRFTGTVKRSVPVEMVVTDILAIDGIPSARSLRACCCQQMPNPNLQLMSPTCLSTMEFPPANVLQMFQVSGTPSEGLVNRPTVPVQCGKW